MLNDLDSTELKGLVALTFLILFNIDLLALWLLGVI